MATCSTFNLLNLVLLGWHVNQHSYCMRSPCWHRFLAAKRFMWQASQGEKNKQAQERVGDKVRDHDHLPITLAQTLQTSR
jgi:hypothetical protein